MSSGTPETTDPEATGPGTGERRTSTARTPGEHTVAIARTVAVVAGLIGILLAVAAPFLPVSYTKAEINWPQPSAAGGAPVVENVAAPNVSFNPVAMDVRVPTRLAARLPADGGVLLSTVPENGVEARKVGLFVTATHDNILVTQRNTVLLSMPRERAQAGDGVITIHADTSGTRGEVTGAPTDGDPTFRIDDSDARPQIIGVYTDLPASTPTDGLAFHSTIDTRFISSPTPLKGTLLIVGIAATIASIIALAVLDRCDGRGRLRILPRRWWRPTFLDGAVTAVLAVWLMIGGNTADDGYQVTVGRVAPGAGYLDNYYRYFGVPQDPFGWHYQYLAKWMEVSTAIPWLRVLPFLFAIACWFLISRAALPRLGRAVSSSTAARWAAALGFLALWLPFNNGLRVEPAIALGILLTWVLVERSIATGRFAPLALGVIAAAFTLTIHPAGAVAAVVLIVSLRPLLHRLLRRRGRDGLLPLLMPIGAAGLSVLYEIFADQPLASIMEGVKVQGIVGPTNKWWNEAMRYYILQNPTPDGSIARRVGVFVTILAVFLVIAVLVRKRRVAGVATASVWRLVGVVGGAVGVLALVPTKATHQLGIYACLTGLFAAVATVFVSPTVMIRRCNRTFFAAAAVYALAVAFSGRNQWWYVGSYGIPWADDTPHLGGIPLFWPIAAVAVALTALGLWQYYRDDRGQDPALPPVAPASDRWSRAPMHALVIISAVALLFTFASFAKAIRTQAGSWSWASSNVASLTGDTCALADGVLVESDPDAGLLPPAEIDGQRGWDPGRMLRGDAAAPGFSPDGVPARIEAEEDSEDTTTTGTLDTTTSDADSDDAGTGDAASDIAGGTTAETGVNGSSVHLPFGLDPDRVPVLGTYGSPDGLGSLTSGWYALPERAEDRPLVTVAVAGQAEYTDELDVRHSGLPVRLEAGRVRPDGAVDTVASLVPLDTGVAPQWRNLRFPVDRIPDGASVVRLVVDDDSAKADQWIAVTSPRMGALTTLNSLVGSDDPVLLDWEVAFAFPCQRPAAAVNGVLETPKWRITPDAVGERVNSRRWMAGDYGGPLGITENELQATEVPSYLRQGWAKDWGTLQRYAPLKPQRTADLTISRDVRPGTWTPGPMRAIKN
ncbi:arabinosyltransferase domain-containing protein [Gordonia shandongensis]|uniref:arabinosyltransferase domain-containing protein n=1 Tax=Gordonia shandongensis TaxID=376351 RepID=UPI0004241BD8|nr:arabinosyltransferase domain-containing protein [Gordonia shandongensis]